jgi:hypothetical protein
LLGACATAGDDDSGPFKRLTTEAAFRDRVVGIPLVRDGGTVLIGADGSLRGTAGRRTSEGAWHWQGDFWCRSARFPDRELPEACQVIEVSQDSVRFVTDEGEGDVVTYRRGD